ncbi:MAG: carboxypeptidase regulatory-like domain-containing protein, partial [Bryobacterales bacterium]|nr:carboxypeptidase regulatory-like domain-containing protein [Bryobacterales bacterium]
MKPISRSVIAWLLFFFACTITPLHSAETTGRIHGRVTDSSGLSVAQAEVTVTNTGLNRAIRVTTNPEGVYVAPKLLLGTYQVSVRVPGFKLSVIEDVHLESGSNAELNFRLELGAVTESVSVVASPNIIDTTTGAQVSSISDTLASRLPNTARDTNSLIRFIPGAVQAATTGGG